ncbi:MAG: zinc metallopeptidase, partial [Anaerolineae bacterium]
NNRGYDGPETARHIMRHANLNVTLEGTDQQLGDHYDPSSHTVRMSPDVASRPSVASMAIVAHELGHAQQHQDGSPLIIARNLLLPAVQIGPTISYGLIFAGLIFNFIGLAWLGVGLFAISVLFMILTLPVEIDASMRALKLLDASDLVQNEAERGGARQVLTAAALTYVAAAITSILNLLYYVSLVTRSRD